ncbi:MAG TPA: hypothetical protein VH062_02015 [Polyangiaceae bacterium]|jgi:hypothetical protein|nr:hypothetical protein [Polyangiaceae bacterium]
MKTLRISDTFAPPVEWLQLSTVTYGASGSGKSAFGRTLAEEAHAAGMRFVVIDVKGDYYGLKSSADGKREGLPIVVFGGDHADVPLDINAGAVFGETIAQLAQSGILDLEHFPKDKRLGFLADFFAALYHHNREPLLVLLDEAQDYAPQTPRGQLGRDAARCLSAVEDLTKMGRKHGIGRVFFTQRGSGLNKEVSEICDVLVAFRTPGTLDQDRVKTWLGSSGSKAQVQEAMARIDGLPTGTALFASSHPAVRHFGVHAVRIPVTFDSSATPTLGRRKQEPTRLATPALDELRARLASTIERVQADDPKALRARIAELEKRSRPHFESCPMNPAWSGTVCKGLNDKCTCGKPPATKVERIEVPVLGDAPVGALVSSAETMRMLGVDLVETARVIREALDRAQGAAIAPQGAFRPVSAGYEPRPRLAHPESVHAAPRAPAPSKGKPALDRRILTLLAQYQGKGMDQARLALHLGLHQRNKGLANTLGRLRTVGFVRGHEITETGLTALGPFAALPTGQRLFDWWFNQKLRPTEARVLQAISERDDWTREDLASRLGVHERNKGLANAIGKLRSLRLVDGMRLSEELVG